MNTISKISIALLGVALLSSCSSLKHKKHGEYASQTEGVNIESGLNDANSSYRLLAPYDQVYYFDFDQYNINPDDLASVNVQARYLSEHSAHPHDAHVRLEGHADERGSREYNVALGWRRAQAVANAIKQQGVNTNQLSVVSYGKEKPTASGHDEASYRLNRRASLVYEKK